MQTSQEQFRNRAIRGRQPLGPRRELPPVRTLSAAVSAAMGVLVAVVPGVSHATGNLIVPNGRTATRLRVRGNVTEIDTSTVRGSVAFNAFRYFQEAGGNTVNLQVPRKAATLLNMVYGGRTVIDGVLNAYHDGRIGGNVVFADPHGLIVGAHGQVNVGALIVTTPTRAFMNRVLSPGGRIDAAVTARLLAGHAPQSADGRIVIDGRIDALHRVTLQAAELLESDTGRMTAGDAAKARMKLFQATVNTQGLRQATSVVEHDGVIDIIGGKSARLSGSLQASGSNRGGAVMVTANTVDVAATARIDASGAEGGGTILIGGGPHGGGPVPAARTVNVAQGARITADATADGDGGQVVVWSRSGTYFSGHISARGGPGGGNGGAAEVSAPIGLNFRGTVDTSAPNGKTGNLLLDPNNLAVVDTVLAGGTSADTASGGGTDTYGNFSQSPETSYIAISTLQALGDTNITLEAFNQITVGDPSTPDTGVDVNLSNLKTATLTLEAGGTTDTGLTTGTTGYGNIVFNTGSSIETGGGNVAVDAGAVFSGAAGTKGQAVLGSIATDGGWITVNAGGSINLPAGAILDSTSATGAGDIMLNAVQAAANGGGLLDLGTVYQSVSPVLVGTPTVSSTATVDVHGSIKGGKIDLQASAQSAASFAGNPQETGLAAKFYKKFGLPTDTLIQGYDFTSTSTATVIVHGGATISGTDVTLASDAKPTISLEGNNGRYLSVVKGDVEGISTAEISPNARVTASGPLSVQATAEPNIAMKVSSSLKGTGPSLTLDYGEANINTQALIDSGANIQAGSVDLSAVNAQSYLVNAAADAKTTGNSVGNAGIAAALSLLNTKATATESANLTGVGDVTVHAASSTDKNVTSADSGAAAGGTPRDQGIEDTSQSSILKVLFDKLLSTVKGKADAPETTSNTTSSSSVTSPGTGSTSSTTKFSLGSALAVNLSDLSAKASIARNTKISSTGDVIVDAENENPGLHVLADSKVESTEASQQAGAGSSETGVSLAVSLGWQSGGAQASISPGAVVAADRVGVNAKNDMSLSFLQPYNEALAIGTELYTQYKTDGFQGPNSLLTSWKTLAPDVQKNVVTFITDLKALGQAALKLPGDIGEPKVFVARLTDIVSNAGPTVLNDYNALPTSVKDAWKQSKVGKAIAEIQASLTSPEGMTSFARAQSDTSKLGVAGAVNYLSLADKAQAWIAPGAQVSLNRLLSAQLWSDPTGADAVHWKAPLAVQSDAGAYTLDGSGNGFLASLGVKSSGGGSGIGVGGAFDWTDVANGAQAWIANGASIATQGNDLVVEANDAERHLTVAPSGGKGAGFAGNGAVAVSRVADRVSAELGRYVTVNAGDGVVRLDASSSVDAASIAGALVKAQSAGVGIGVALNLVDPKTTAGVTDTSTLTQAVNEVPVTASSATACISTVCLSAGSLDVSARAQGAIAAFGVAGAQSGGSSSSPSSAGSGSSSGGSGGTSLLDSIKGAFASLKSKIQGGKSTGQSVSGGLNQTASATDNAQGQLDSANTSTSAKSGSHDAVQSSLKTGYQQKKADTLSSEAGGSSASGQGDKQPKLSLAVAGSAAVNVTQFETHALLDGAKVRLTKGEGLTVRALRSSNAVALAGAGALATKGGSGSSSSSVAIAGTLSLNVLNSDTQAEVQDSTVTLDAAGAGFGVQAVTGGQAVAVGLGLAASGNGKKSLASIVGSGSVTIARARTQALLVDSTLSNTVGAPSGAGAVQALDATRIGTGAGSLFAGGKVGIGMAVSVAMTQDQTTAAMQGGSVSGFSNLSVQAFSPAMIASAAAVGGFGGSRQVLNLSGAVVVNEIQDTTRASIGADSQQNAAAVTLGSRLTVQASTQDASSLSGLLTSTTDLGYDFTGSGLPTFGGSSAVLGGQGSAANHDQSPAFTAASSAPASTPGASIIGVAGTFQAGSGKASVGLSGAYNAISDSIGAQVGNTSVTLGTASTPGTLMVSAENDARILGIAAGASVGAGKFSAVGSFSINNLGGSTQALLGDTQASADTTTVEGLSSAGPQVNVNAGDRGTIWSGAGTVSAGSKVGVGASIALNLAGGETEASVSHARIDAAPAQSSDPALSVIASSSRAIDSAALAVSASSTASIGGSLDLTIDTGSTQTGIEDSKLTLAGGLQADATDNSAIWDGAGALAILGKAGVGIGAAVNVTHHTVAATLANDTLSAAKQSVDVSANRNGFIASGGVGASVGGRIAAGVGVVANVDSDQVSATVSGINAGTQGSGSAQVIVPAPIGSLNVAASDSAKVYAIGGALAGASTAAGGGAVAVNWLNEQVGAGLTSDVLAVSGPLSVGAQGQGQIGALAAAVAGAGDGALAGSVTTNFLDSDIAATVSSDTLTGAGLDLTISADNHPTIESIAIGAAGTPGVVGAGAGVAVNDLRGITRAELSGGAVRASDVMVHADSSLGITTLSVGVGAAVQGVGVAGAIVTDLLSGTTTADIAGGAQVLATDNVGVLAGDSNTIDAATGNFGFGQVAAAGASVVVNDLADNTTAYIGAGGGRTSVTALGNGSALSVDSGQLTAPPAVGASTNASNYSLPSLSETTTAVHGVAVNAQSLNAVSGLSAGAAFGFNPDPDEGFFSLALEADTTTNVLGGATSAYTDSATINTMASPALDQAVSVIAGRHDFAGGLATGFAGSVGWLAGTGVIGVNTFDAVTDAHIQGGTVDAAGTIAILARSSQDSVGLGAGAAVSLVGVAGTGLVNLYQDTTQAYAQDGGLTAVRLDIRAHSRSGVNLIGGAVSGGAEAVGATFLVLDGDNTTQAWLGDPLGLGSTDVALNGGDLDVSSDSQTRINAFGITGSMGLGVGEAMAGNAVAIVLANTTTADINHVQLHSAKNVTVQAQDVTDVQSYAGTLAIGIGSTGLGVGASANVLVFHDTVNAGVTDSTLNAAGTVLVLASADKAAQLVTVTGGAGDSAGIGGGAGLILFGSGRTGSAMGSLNKDGTGTLFKQGGLSQTNSVVNDSSLSVAQQQQIGSATSVDLVTEMSRPVQDATTATVQGGSISAAVLDVAAGDTTATRNIAGSAGVGGVLGIGAAIAVTRSYATVGAVVNGTAVTANSVTVSASAKNGKQYGGQAIDGSAYAGGAGLLFGLGAAIADGRVDNTVSAVFEQGSLSGDGSGTLDITANDGESVNVNGIGASAGAATVGVVDGTASRASRVSSSLDANANGYDGGSVLASGSGAAASSVVGASAGIYSGNAAVAAASDSSTILASVGANSTLDMPGGVFRIKADSNPAVSANATGVSAGIGSIGASMATANSAGTLSATVGDHVQFTGAGGVSISAQGAPTVFSNAIAGTGAGIGAQAVVSKADNTIDVSVQTGTGVRLPDGDVRLNAGQTGSVSASGTGVLAGVLAAGAVVVNADATPVVDARLGAQTGSRATRTGNLTIEADGADTLAAHSTSGAGGVGVGNAATATTNLNATTSAGTSGTSGTLHAGNFVLSALHVAKVTSQADSTNVSLAGGGAALARSDSTSAVGATYGAGTNIEAGSVTIGARNDYAQPKAGWNADGSAGGGINFNLVKATTTLNLTTDTTMEPGTLTIVGDPAEPTLHSLSIGAENSVQAYLGAKVATGGVVQGLISKADFNGTADATVDVQKGAWINATGNITLYSGTNGSVQTSALAHAWGGAGVVNSDAASNLSARQSINVAGTVRSNNDIRIGAGYDRHQGGDALFVGASSHAYNYTALAVGTNPSVSATLHNANQVTVSGSVLAGGNAVLQAGAGQHVASGTAIGKNSYQEVTQKIVNFFIDLINFVAHKTVIRPVTLEFRSGGRRLDQSTTDVNVTPGGTVEAGLAGDQKLRLELNGKNQVVAGPGSSSLVGYDLASWNYYHYLKGRETRLKNQAASTTDQQVLGRLFFERQMVKNEISALEDSKGNPYPVAERVPLVTLSPILVRSGNVSIDAANTTISGTVEAYGAKGVTIDNTSPAFLQVGNITVQGGGGQVFLNGAVDVARSNPGTVAPSVTIDSSFTPATGSREIVPDIFLTGTIYNPSGAVTVTDSAGSIHQNGLINGGSVSIAALNGGYFQGYQTGYHTPGNRVPVTKQAAIIAGGPVFVAAQYLNVDGLIQSGHDRLAVTLPTSLDSILVALKHAYSSGTTELKAYINNNDNLSYDPTTGYVRITPAASITNPDIIPTFWDPKNNWLVLNAADSLPGRVYLYGNIFNTGSNARIIAASGLAQIRVDNQTDLPLVVQRLNAGNVDAGGLVQITDTAKSIYAPDKAGDQRSWSQVTEYRFSPLSGDISVYRYAAGAPGAPGAVGSTTLQDTAHATSDSYRIATDGHGAWYLPQAATLSANGASYTLQPGVYRPGSSDLTVTIPKNLPTYTLTYKFGSAIYKLSGVPAGSPLLLFCNGFCKATPSSATGPTTTITKLWDQIPSIAKADNPIAIRFIGQSAGDIRVTSPSGIWLDGGVNNPTGTVTLLSTGGVVGSLSSTAAINGIDVNLTAGDGIGSGGLQRSRPLLVNLVGIGGALNASSAGGDIDVTSQGRLALGHVSAPAGAVTLAGQDGIVSTVAGQSAVVSGGDLNLTAANGAVGGLVIDGGALVIDAGGTANANAPYGAINLTQAVGDLHVGRIDAGGDVTLSAPGGSIVSALAQTVNQQSLQQLQAQWNSFGLTNASAKKAAQDNLTHITKGFGYAYGQYWTLRNRIEFSGSGADLKIAGLTQAGYDAYRPAAAAYYGAPDPSTLSQASILGYVNNVIGKDLVTQYSDSNMQLGQLEQNYGFTSTQIAPFLNSQDTSGFANAVAAGLQQRVTKGASWTQDQLLHTVSQQAVFGVAQPLNTQTPNIVTPGTITLRAGTAEAKLGGYSVPVTIQLPGSSGQLALTAQQEEALAAAAPGDISRNGTPSGTTLTITQYHPVYIQGSGRVDAQAGDGLYLSAGTGDLTVGTFASPGGQIRLSAQGSLLQDPSGSGLTGAGDGTVLFAVNGSIGDVGVPLRMHLSGALDSVKAGVDVYIDELSGGLELGNLYSGGTGSITVDHGGITSSFTDVAESHLRADHLILNTAGDVGRNVPLAVTLGAGGVSGQVGGALDLVSPTADLAVSGVTADGPVSLDALQGSISLDSFRSNAASGPAVTLHAATSLEGASPGGAADIAAPAVGAEVSLTAGTDIGRADRYLVLDTPILTQADTADGGVYITDLQGLTLSSIHGLGGSISLRVDGDLSFDSVLAGSDLILSAQGDMHGGHAASVTGVLTAIAGRDLDIGTVSSPKTVRLTASTGSITVDTLTAAQATLAAQRSITLGQARIQHAIGFYSRRLQAVVDQTRRSGGPLNVGISGWNGALTDYADLRIGTIGNVDITPLGLVDGRIQFSGPAFTVKNGYVSGSLRFVTPESDIVVDNRNPALQNTDVQLYQPSSPFSLVQQGISTFTNAFVEHFVTGYRVTVPNYWSSHSTTAVDYEGGSAYIRAGRIAGERVRRRVRLLKWLPQSRYKLITRDLVATSYRVVPVNLRPTHTGAGKGVSRTIRP